MYKLHKPGWGVLLISPRGDADCVAFWDNITEVLFSFRPLGSNWAQWRILKSAVTIHTMEHEKKTSTFFYSDEGNDRSSAMKNACKHRHTHTHTNGFSDGSASLFGCAVVLEALSRPAAAAAHPACCSLMPLCWRKWWKAVSSNRIGASPVRTEPALIGLLQWTLVTRVTMIQQEWLHADAISASSLLRRATWGRRFYHRKPNEATWAFGENELCKFCLWEMA